MIEWTDYSRSPESAPRCSRTVGKERAGDEGLRSVLVAGRYLDMTAPVCAAMGCGGRPQFVELLTGIPGAFRPVCRISSGT
jgi:hypothetical protein